MKHEFIGGVLLVLLVILVAKNPEHSAAIVRWLFDQIPKESA